MAFKDKLKDAFKRVSDLDDETESAKKQAKKSERIPYKDISKKLKEIMKDNVDVVGRKILIPNYYAIFFNETDRNLRLEVEDVMCQELREELFHEMRKINPEQNRRDLLIEAKTDPSLEKGEFKVVHRMKSPVEGQDVPDLGGTSQESQPDVSNENDFQQTVIETPSLSDDDQATIIQIPESAVQYTLIIDSGETEEHMVMTKPIITLGRSTQDDVVLESEDFSISRAHATLEVREGEYYLTPSGINGTSLNGEELELKEEVKVTPEDEITIMNYTIRIQA